MRAKLMVAAAVVQGAEKPRIALYDGLGTISFPIATSNPLAQRYFDQGLGFAYGFNHAAAVQSFREAQKADPDCAHVLLGRGAGARPQHQRADGPGDGHARRRAGGLANWLARRGTAEERALTGAMLNRYSLAPNADRAALDAAYADAMLAPPPHTRPTTTSPCSPPRRR